MEGQIEWRHNWSPGVCDANQSERSGVFFLPIRVVAKMSFEGCEPAIDNEIHRKYLRQLELQVTNS